MKKDITNLYCFIDDFTKECEKEIKKHAIESGIKNKPTRISGLKQAEMITIILLFQQYPCRNINYDPGSTVGKYLYTRGLSINSTLLNIHKVKEGGEVIIVEGVLDCLHAGAKGIENVIALGGTGFNKNQINL